MPERIRDDVAFTPFDFFSTIDAEFIAGILSFNGL
jgi:hypothetical protein